MGLPAELKAWLPVGLVLALDSRRSEGSLPRLSASEGPTVRLIPGGSELRRLLRPGRSGGVGTKLPVEPSEVALTVSTTPECCCSSLQPGLPYSAAAWHQSEKPCLRNI